MAPRTVECEAVDGDTFLADCDRVDAALADVDRHRACLVDRRRGVERVRMLQGEPPRTNEPAGLLVRG